MSKFTVEERKAIDPAIAAAVGALQDWVLYGTEFCMNQYNGT